ncbi:MAG: alanyl-tRNA editing protein [Clostridia bacterium]|nr:alanyl-tRNA editing protein [Clostridia bacterium]
MTERKVKNTERIYEKDSSVSAFEATVLSCDGGEGEYKIELDRTAFFPTGGGQSCDNGMLNGVRVSDVRVENGEIIHTVSSPIEVGAKARGVIDYPERLRKMCAHTAEHILSSVLNKKYGCANVGFHLGTVDTTCDFDIVLSAEQLNDAEDEANRIIRENYVVYPYFPSESELKTLEYRSKLELTEDVRIVMIGENGSVDKCACCAPHVSETGKIGFFKIVDSYKYKGGTRVHILTAEDAVCRARADFEGIKAISVLLSAKPNGSDVISAVSALGEENKLLKNEISFLNEKINALICASHEGGRLAVIFDERKDQRVLRSLCLLMLTKAEAAAVFGGEEGAYSFVIAGKNAQEIFAEMKASLNIRGGGKDVICGTVFEGKGKIETVLMEKNI